jgi:Family of unknown function (DUF5317)
MIQVVAVLLVLLSVPLFGGSIARVGELRVKAVWAAAAAIGVQVVLTEFDALHGFASYAAHFASYGLAAWFVIANLHVRGLWIIGLGGAANLLAISANGGVMPASPAAARLAGLAADAGRFQNSAVVGHARLAFLGDVFAWPHPLPLANVFSVGDVLLVVGIGYVLHSAAGSRWPRRRAV